MLEALTAGPLLELQSPADLAHSCPRRRQGLSQLLLALMFLHNDYFPRLHVEAARCPSGKFQDGPRGCSIYLELECPANRRLVSGARETENLLDDRPQKLGEHEGSEIPLEISLPSCSQVQLCCEVRLPPLICAPHHTLSFEEQDAPPYPSNAKKQSVSKGRPSPPRA